MLSWVANLAPMTPTLLWSKRSLFLSPSLCLRSAMHTHNLPAERGGGGGGDLNHGRAP